MGFVSDMFSGSKGAGFQAQGVANMLQPATVAQATNLYNQAQSGIGQQQAFVDALQAQGGLGNQSSVFNQQQGLANQLGLQAQGQGPNPAQAALNQNTSQNIANQAALMAGQRGSSANTGLLARQAGQQGGQLQQQSVGQAAVMQAQQQLAAQHALQQQQGMMGNLASQQVGQQATGLQNLNAFTQGEQQNILGSIANQNNANVSNQAGVNNANAGIAHGNQAFQAGVVNKLAGAAGSGATTAAAHGGMIESYADGGDVEPSDKKLFENSLREFMGTPLTQGPTAEEKRQAEYERIREKNRASGSNYADGGPVPQSNFGRMLNGYAGGGEIHPIQEAAPIQNRFVDEIRKSGEGTGEGLGKFGGMFKSSPIGGKVGSAGASDLSSSAPFTANKGGKVPAKVSPGEVYLSPKKVEKVAEGKSSPLSGEKIHGKAKVKGDSLKNDTVSKTLQSGGIVLPRSVTQHPNAPQKAHDFVAALLAKQGRRG